MDWTTTGLLASIRRRASIPTTATTGGLDADLLAFANEELRLGLVSKLLTLRESYFKRDSDSTIAAATTSYRIPTRAVGGKLASVRLLDSAGGELGVLTEVPDERLEDYSGLSSTAAYRVLGNSLVLVPSAVTSAVTLRQTYFAQPSELVASGYATISAINTSTNVVTTSAIHGYTTSSVLDLVRASEGFESLAIDQTPTAVGSTTTLTFSSLPSGLAVGDYVCVFRQSPVPQIPSEFHPILAQRVACAYLEAQGAPELAAAVKKLEAMEEAIGILSSPRVDSGSKKIINRFSPLGVSGARRWGV